MSENQKGIDPSDVVKNPEKYGIRWTYHILSRGEKKDQVLRNNAPLFSVVETKEGVEAFIAAFGHAMMAKGTRVSFRVSQQALERPQIEKNPNITNDELKLRIVNHVLLGQITRGASERLPVFEGPNGETYKSREEMQAAWKTATAAPTVDEGQAARDYVEELVSLGVDVAKAIAKAQEKYPNAMQHS